jgi:hypothetical protein
LFADGLSTVNYEQSKSYYCFEFIFHSWDPSQENAINDISQTETHTIQPSH